MINDFARQRMKYVNDFKRSASALIGIAQGLICDNHLTDHEINFLNNWLTQNDEIARRFPGDIISQKSERHHSRRRDHGRGAATLAGNPPASNRRNGRNARRRHACQ